MRLIRFTRQGSNSVFGGFDPGDTLRCSDAMASHLVGEARCAVYADEPAAAAPPAPQQSSQAAPRRKRAAATATHTS